MEIIVSTIVATPLSHVRHRMGYVQELRSAPEATYLTMRTLGYSLALMLAFDPMRPYLTQAE